MKFIANRNHYSCFIACIESFIDSTGAIRTQENIIIDHPDLCQWDKNKKGVIPIGKEKELCAREKILLEDFYRGSDVDSLIPSLQSGKNFIIGVFQRKTPTEVGMHAVLFDSFGQDGDVIVMDPDKGHKALNRDYEEIEQLILYRLSKTTL
jgi:hypothetical protein